MLAVPSDMPFVAVWRAVRRWLGSVVSASQVALRVPYSYGTVLYSISCARTVQYSYEYLVHSGPLCTSSGPWWAVDRPCNRRLGAKCDGMRGGMRRRQGAPSVRATSSAPEHPLKARRTPPARSLPVSVTTQEPAVVSLQSPDRMAKSTNHTAHNQAYKKHRNGIKKPKKQVHHSTKGMDPKFLRNQKYCKKHMKKVGKSD